MPRAKDIKELLFLAFPMCELIKSISGAEFWGGQCQTSENNNQLRSRCIYAAEGKK